MDDSKLSTLTAYLARGWALVPLHDVSAGVCSCMAASLCRNAGKHPRYRDWPLARNLVRDVTTLATLHAASPQWNWGVATGPASGIWVLDVDPRHDGDRKLAEITGNLVWPDTFTVRTGGGGWHYYFAMPPDFTPTNSRGRLPVGIDVRGAGGQVVVPPSVSDVGKYLVHHAHAASAASDWLLDLIRPTATAPVSTTALPDLSGRNISTGAGRGPAYAAAALQAIVEELRATPAGDRNNAAFRAACRVVELYNAPWSGLGEDSAAYEAWYAAAAAHPGGVVVPDIELRRVWGSALRHVGDRPADPPGDQPWIGGVMLPLPAPPAPESVATGVGESTGNAYAPAFLLPDSNLTVGGVPAAPPVDPFEHAVAVELGRLAVREEARRRHAAALGGTAAERLAQMRERALSSKALKARPAAPMLVSGLLARNSLARVVGAPGTGKSFIALDLMACLATGAEWAGVAPGEGAPRVLAMVAEGLDGTAVRLQAWEYARGVEIADERLTWYPEAVQAADTPAWDAFLLFAAEVDPDLIVIDTQARVTVGVNENDAGEMGVLVAAMERLRAVTGACVLLVHHTPLTAERARGNGAVLGAMATELLVRREGKVIELSILKQKDGPEDLTWQFELRPVAVPAGDGPFLVPSATPPVAPFWLDPATTGTAGRRRPVLPSAERLTGFLAAAAGAIAEVHGTPAATATKAEIRKTLEAYGAFGSDATFKRTWASLLERRIIGQIRGTQQYRHVPVDERAALTDPRLGEADGAAGFYIG